MSRKPRLVELRDESLSFDEIEEFYSLAGVDIPRHRPYLWSMTVVSLDGIISFLERGAMGGKSIALKHIEHSGSGADWRLLNAGWMYADAVLGTGQILRAEPQSKWIPRYEAMLNYRQKTLRKETLYPMNIVLTDSGRVDMKSPIFNDNTFTTVIITSPGGREIILRAAEEATKSNFYPFDKGDTRLEVIGRQEVPQYPQILNFIREDLGVKFLDVTAGGMVIAALVRDKLLDECRITYAGHFAGPHNSEGKQRPGLFDLGKDDYFTPENNPLLKFDKVRSYGDHLLFIRGTLVYRH